MKLTKLFLLLSLFLLAGCESADVPAAHKGRIFDRTGPLALYSGGKGFEGPVLGPGSYYLGHYPELRTVECSQKVVKEALPALTRDGVQFEIDLNVGYAANCAEDGAVKEVLEAVSPDKDGRVTGEALYGLYVRPALSEAIRQAVSPYIANDINSKREQIFAEFKGQFEAHLKAAKPGLKQPVLVSSLNLANLDFPDSMDKANADRAAVAIAKDKALAEQDKVRAEIETAKLEVEKQKVMGQADAARVEAMGQAYRKYPEVLVREVYLAAGEKGNAVLLPNDPRVMIKVGPKGELPRESGPERNLDRLAPGLARPGPGPVRRPGEGASPSQRGGLLLLPERDVVLQGRPGLPDSLDRGGEPGPGRRGPGTGLLLRPVGQPARG
jgi:regulator of protease activity HflC (stomatin/prohibitin superfamily)